ncbi:MAG: S49 family peptidase [Hyphomicrobiales bacterium]
MSKGSKDFLRRLRGLLPKKMWENTRASVIPVIRLSGVIGARGAGLPSGLTLNSVAPTLERAFRYERAPAIAIQVNSPGGSPVQASLIFRRIRALADKHKKPVYAFAEDAAASGGYFLALSGDEIHADASSIIGSIGVISTGFGFVEAIDKLGVERRVYTTGENKSTLDPFKPESAEDVTRLKAVQETIHETFKAVVRERRGKRLKEKDESLFTGAFWSGVRAKELGLIDGIGDMYSVLRAKFGEDVICRLVNRNTLLKRVSLPGFVHSGGNAMEFCERIVATIEARALWSRLGL